MESNSLFFGRGLKSRVIFEILLNGLRPSAWNADFESGSNAQFTFNFNFTFMCFSNMLTDTEPKAAATFIT